MKRLVSGNPVLRVIIISTLVFFVVLAAAAGIVSAMPGINARHAENAIAAGSFDTARQLAGKLDDESARRELLNRCDYAEALCLMDRGDWESAGTLFLSLGTYGKSEELFMQCRYNFAGGLAAAGELEKACGVYSELGGYSDAPARALACRYAQAEEMLNAGDESRAFSIFLELGDYSDAAKRAGETAMGITGLHDPETAINSLKGLSPEALEKQAELAEARSALPEGIAAVGFYHSVALCPDGTVISCGADDYGQCRTEGWRNVTAVAAGAYHSLALHSDGTVSAAGRSSEGQCDVLSWRNVVKIAATDWASLGLTSDGRVLYSGFNDFSGLEKFGTAADVFGGSYSAALLGADGAFLIDPQLADAGLKKGAVSLALGTGFAAALYPDGSLVLSTDGECFGENCTAVSACDAFILMLGADGSVSCRSFRASSAPDVSGLDNIVAMDAGSTHCAYVSSDGELILRGDNSRGQLELSGTKLF